LVAVLLYQTGSEVTKYICVRHFAVPRGTVEAWLEEQADTR
jgi:hypothetical protein